MAEELNFKQELVAVFGKPVAENPTQVMIEAAFRHHGLNWRYLTVEVDPADLEAAVRGGWAMGFQGFNCTIPHKVAVIDFLDGLGESASLMRAVNCVVRRENGFIGENTDGKGFLKGLKEKTDPTGKRAVILGAGGAARAISVELALAGVAHITLVNRTADRGSALVKLLNDSTDTTADFVSWDGDYDVPEGTDLLINATSIGLFPDVDARVQVNMDTVTPSMLVADVIPNPPKTRLVREATERGCTVIDGLAMLVDQGVIGIKYWTGIDADAAVMRQALEDVFGS